MSITFFNRDALTLVLTGKEIEQFKEILARGLNTAPPEKFPGWIKFSDDLSKAGIIQESSPINSINSSDQSN